jgi:SAM-dependent methyltransferase
MFFSPRIRPSRSPQLLIAACFLLAAASGPNALATEAESTAKTLLDMTGVSGGLIVHVGCGEGALTAALGGRAGVVVQGLDRDPEHVAAARHRLRSLGRYGSTSVQLLTGTRLPYADNLVNLLVADGPQDLPVKELMRVVAPGGSVCLGSGDDWHKIVKPRPTDIDEWTHYLHDASGNAVAADQQVAPPKQLRWVSGPLWSRSHELNPSINALVSGGGRMFYILDEGIAGLADLRFPARWTLYARDAFSGVLLWKRTGAELGLPGMADAGHVERTTHVESTRGNRWNAALRDFGLQRSGNRPGRGHRGRTAYDSRDPRDG